MNRANQQALFQQTNQGLLGIRQSEVNYYQNLNVAFGTQAALVGGFTYGVFTQNEINYGNNYHTEDYIADVYWIMSAITIAVSVHVILCTMLMQVLGPGLALHGSVGSMARATEGMRLEQQQIITAFVAMMIMFSLSTVLSCWMVMSYEASVGCSVAFAIAACYWYKYCERIYLRFYWDPEESGWNTGDSSGELNELNPAGDREEPIHMPVNKSVTSTASSMTRAQRRRRWLLGLFQRSTNQNEADASDFTTNTKAAQMGASGDWHLSAVCDAPVPMHPKWVQASAERGVVMEGYLTKLGGQTSQRLVDFRAELWERRYFTLSNTACLFIYKTRQDYRNDPKNPIFTRPLRLMDYYIEVYNGEKALLDGKDDTSTISTIEYEPSVDPAGAGSVRAKEMCFQLTLILREHADDSEWGNIMERMEPGAARRLRYQDHWELRCDTAEELHRWVRSLQELCPSCFRFARS